jgi:histidinol-phosphate phosphatase family protein
MHEITQSQAFNAITELIPRKRAVFLDRDGTLCHDAHYLNSWDGFRLLDGLGELARLKDAGLELIGVSNQSGIGRGIVSKDFVGEVNDLFMREHGFSAFYHCPHRPDENCSCRKPEPGMIMRARLERCIALRGSFVIGDKDDDMLLGRAVSATTVLVQTGKQQSSAHADHVTPGLAEAVSFVLSRL